MYNYLILPIGYIALFVFFSFMKSIDDFFKKIIFCPVCITYFTMLIIGLILRFDVIILSLQLGMSITGIAYLISEKAKDKWYGNLFIAQFTLTIIGLIIIYYLKGG